MSSRLDPADFALLGGPATHWFSDTKTLANVIVGPQSPLRSSDNNHAAGVEISLGIKTEGNSELLLTGKQANAIVRHFSCSPPPRRRTVWEYESVSPILFHSPAELEQKLKMTYKRSAKGKAKRAEVNSDAGVGRGAFEHGRVVHSILNDRLDPNNYGLPEATWKGTLKVLSLAFNTRARDTRPSSERRSHPWLVDVGWSEAVVPDVRSPKEGSTKHYRMYEERYMNAGGVAMPFSYGKTEELEKKMISEKVQEVFGNRTERMREPVIVLVHDERLARSALKNSFGVDTSEWVLGIKDLLGHGRQEIKRESSSFNNWSRSSVKREEYDYGRYRGIKQEDAGHSSSYRGRRSRSPSPRRYIKPDPERPPAYNHRDYNYKTPALQRGDGGDRTYAPVYIVDVKQLYVNLMRMENGSESIVQIAQRFNIRAEDDNGWCAGNEVVLLFEIWHSMISGPPIDEQNKAREKGWMDGPNEQQQQQAPIVDEDDEDFDPNDIPTVAVPIVEKKGGLYESDSDDYYEDD